VNPYALGPRLAAVAFRAAHLGSMSMLVGGRWFAVPPPSLRLWQLLTALSGVALLLTELSHSRHWVYQGRGVTTVAHVAVLGLKYVAPALTIAATVAALVIGAVGSHLPRSVRKWSFRHGRVLD
jgi:hypothetical protein